MREEEVKNRVREQYFSAYDATPILGDIDFAVALRHEGPELFDREYFLWAEAKNGTGRDIYASLIQLIITIGKARTYTRHLPPAFLGAFDEERMAFVRYSLIADTFHRNDFNWRVTPSDHQTPEFRSLYQTLHDALQRDVFIFSLRDDDRDLRRFIRQNFRLGQSETRGIEVTRNNFVFVYRRWEREVKPTIALNWDKAPSERPVDYFLADLISRDDRTLLSRLQVKLRGTEYNIDRGFDPAGIPLTGTLHFTDGQKAYREFWNKYRRPPGEDAVRLILDRRDLLATEDKRAYYGAFYTPTQWVEKSREYLARELGDDWQERYYIWDCAAGTGNLLVGLTEPYRTWASTLEDGDVNIIRQRVADRNLALLDKHVFQFDFLNDNFDRLPQSLQDVINDPQRRRHLIIYINPPYAEAGNVKQLSGTGTNKKDVAVVTQTYKKYVSEIGIAGRELFAQFFIRAYKELPGSILAEFSKLKVLQAPNFNRFRQVFQARLSSSFCVPANTFDNVKGNFPIGFFIWHLEKYKVFTSNETQFYDANGCFIMNKSLNAYDGVKSINDWIISTRNRPGEEKIGFMSAKAHDFQNTNYNFIVTDKSLLAGARGSWVTTMNIKEIAVYLAVRKVIPATWLNDRDQFLCPNEGWETDYEFQGDCLAYTLFSSANNIQSRYGVNHWIPYTESEVGACDCFRSHFMRDYISGNLAPQPCSEPTLPFADAPADAGAFADGGTSADGGAQVSNLRNWERTFPTSAMPGHDTADVGNVRSQSRRLETCAPVVFSPEARAVIDAGRELWRYYHRQPGAVADASYYDIRLYFQGTKTTKSGKEQMSPTSSDAQYTALLATLRQAHAALARRIEPKVYEYGFLMR